MFKKIINKIWRLVKLVPLATLIVFLILATIALVDIRNEDKAKNIEKVDEKSGEAFFFASQKSFLTLY